MPDFYTGPKHAPSVLTIDLEALKDNYRILQRETNGIPVSAVIKSDGYGLGSVPIAKALHSIGCKVFFVAHLDEALTVRDALPNVEIGILNGLLPDEMSYYPEYNLLPILNDIGQVMAWQNFCQTNTPMPAAMQIDTGMARLGMPASEAKILAEDKSMMDAIPLKYLMSHLACPDEPDHPMNRQQQQEFAKWVEIWPEPIAMLAASSGIFLGKDWHFDMVRPGVALYGAAPNDTGSNPLKQLVRLQAKIIQIREIDAGLTVGYGASHIVDKKTRVATLPVGYADGYIRSLSNQACLYHGDKKVPILGRVSMDLLTVDISDIPEACLGSMIDVIGPNNDINQVAKEAGTIPYEILTQIGIRYRRHYLES